MKFDQKKFEAEAARLRTEEREPRTLDLLIQQRDTVLGMLQDGLTGRHVFSALKAGGVSITYAAFCKALSEFRELCSLPTPGEVLKSRRRAKLGVAPSRLPAAPAKAPSVKPTLTTSARAALSPSGIIEEERHRLQQQ